MGHLEIWMFFCKYMKFFKINFILQGGRALEDFLKYVAEQASSELKGWDRKGNAKKDEL